MNISLKTFIAEEKFARKFVKAFNKSLLTAIALDMDTFKVKESSCTTLHWMGGYASANNTECIVAHKIIKQLLSYYETDYRLDTESSRFGTFVFKKIDKECLNNLRKNIYNRLQEL